MNQYFIQANGESKGPYTTDELTRLNLERTTLVWFQGLENWQPIESIAELNSLTKRLPPMLPQVSDAGSATIAIPPLKMPKRTKTRQIWLVGIGMIILLFLYWLSILPSNNIAAKDHTSHEIQKMVTAYQPDFSLYVDKFYRDAEFYGLYPQRPEETIIKLAELDKIRGLTHYHGLSFGKDDDNRVEIYLDARSWKSANKAKRFFIIYHELAHDVLNSEHSPSSSNSRRPLMATSISQHENVSMDNFIEAMHGFFDAELNK